MSCFDRPTEIEVAVMFDFISGNKGNQETFKETFWKGFKMFRYWKSTKRFGNLKCPAKVEKKNSLPLCFCTCNQDFFYTKTCLVPFVKPFYSFELT